MRQSSKNLPVVLAFDGYAADAFFVERPVGEPTRIGHNHHTASARFGGGEQTAGLVAGAFWRFLVQIVHHERAWFRRMRQVQQQQIARVISPSEPADDRRRVRTLLLPGNEFPVGRERVVRASHAGTQVLDVVLRLQ